MIHVVIGNLPPAVTAPQLASFFADYGDVERVEVGKNAVTGRAERFCFLDLEQKPGHELAGARLWGHALSVGRAASPSGWTIDS